MTKVDLNELAAQMRANSEKWFPAWHDGTLPLDVSYALGLGGEAGEVLNVVKKLHRDGAHSESENDLGLEIADTFTYLLLLAHEKGIDVLDAYERKRRICEQRWIDRVSVLRSRNDLRPGDVDPGCGKVVEVQQHAAGISQWYVTWDREGWDGSIPPNAPAWEPGCNVWTNGGAAGASHVIIPREVFE